MWIKKIVRRPLSCVWFSFNRSAVPWKEHHHHHQTDFQNVGQGRIITTVWYHWPSLRKLALGQMVQRGDGKIKRSCNLFMGNRDKNSIFLKITVERWLLARLCWPNHHHGAQTGDQKIRRCCCQVKTKKRLKISTVVAVIRKNDPSYFTWSLEILNFAFILMLSG